MKNLVVFASSFVDDAVLNALRKIVISRVVKFSNALAGGSGISAEACCQNKKTNRRISNCERFDRKTKTSDSTTTA